jgi:hypothetical protein
MRVSLHKHGHIEAPVREEGPLGSDVVFARESDTFYLLLNFEMTIADKR